MSKTNWSQEGSNRFPEGWPTDADIAAVLQPIKMRPASGEWISAREARLLVATEARVTFGEAEAALCRRALNWVRVAADSFSRAEDPHDYISRIEYFKDRPADLTHFSDEPSQTAWSEALNFFADISGYVPILGSERIVTHCWATGEFRVTIERDFSDVTLEVVGLKFDKVGVLESIGLYDKPSGASEGKEVSHNNGRPALNHGEAIANITLRLSGMPRDDVDRYTSKQLVADLAAEYERLGEVAPSATNRARIAAGVLRAFRAGTVS
jgi:hypothetical protein